ncbi:MAG: hypothetical protein L0229_29725 [Blastocatellia bacterium]|nr:hypothetical protein [Blastocatellia bacterium]
MTCAMCAQEIGPDELNLHHGPVYRSEGGTVTEPVHRSCHVRFHSVKDDFRAWGRIGGQISALSKRWSFNLRNVKDDPLYEQARAFHLTYYSEATQ